MNILVQFPTRGRVEKFREVHGKLKELASGEHDIRVQVVCDHDDEEMTEIARAFNFDDNREESPHFGTHFAFGDHKTKIEACNAFLPGESAWDILVLISDDMVPVEKDWDAIICADLVRNFPDLDGAMHYFDGFVDERCCTLPIMGRPYYERFGYVYEPGYKSLFCDEEFTDVGKILGCIKYSETMLFRHEHPGTTGCNRDELYVRNDKFWDEDKDYFQGRKAKRFFLPLLDILICSIPTRLDLLAVVSGQLKEQITDGGYEHNVNVIVERDATRMTIGVKRNALIARSRAEYICHVDDDDQVSPTYVSSIMSAIEQGGVDCIALVGKIRSGSERKDNWRPFIHSIRYDRFYQLEDGTYVRPPNHLNPIKRKIAARFPFVDISHAEDTDFALRMCRAHVLKTERLASKGPIYHYIPSAWYANRLGRRDGHAAVNLADMSGAPQLEQDRRPDNLPPEEKPNLAAVNTRMEPAPEPSAPVEQQAPAVDRSGKQAFLSALEAISQGVSASSAAPTIPIETPCQPTGKSRHKWEGTPKDKLRRLRRKG